MKQIKNYPNYSITESGEVINKYGKALKPTKSHDGYYYVTLYNTDKRKKYKIHRLVADAYIPNPDNLPVVNHKDGNKLNNHYTNLEHTTVQKNTQHSFDNQLQIPLRGEQQKNAKLTEECVLAIRASNEPIKVLAERYNVSISLISGIHNYKYWKHI